MEGKIDTVKLTPMETRESVQKMYLSEKVRESTSPKRQEGLLLIKRVTFLPFVVPFAMLLHAKIQIQNLELFSTNSRNSESKCTKLRFRIFTL